MISIFVKLFVKKSKIWVIIFWRRFSILSESITKPTTMPMRIKIKIKEFTNNPDIDNFDKRWEELKNNVDYLLKEWYYNYGNILFISILSFLLSFSLQKGKLIFSLYFFCLTSIIIACLFQAATHFSLFVWSLHYSNVVAYESSLKCCLNSRTI